MGDVVNIRQAVERIRDRHKPGKLVGIYRGLRRSHAASVRGEWTSAAGLVADILNQMIRHGSTLWWDLVDLDFSSMASPDSTRDEIGIRTLVGQVERGINSPSFITVVGVTREYPARGRDDVEVIEQEVLRKAVVMAAKAYGVPTGGFFPMLENIGTAIDEAGLSVSSVSINGDHVNIGAFIPDSEDGRETTFMIIIDFKNLLNDIDTIRTSLASRGKDKE